MNASDPTPVAEAVRLSSAAPVRPPRRSRLWLCVLAAFLVQAAVWATWLTLASKHRVAEVPLASSGRR